MWYKWLYKTQKKSQNLKTVAFCCHDLGPLVLWGWRVTANQSKVVLGDYFCPVTKYFWSDESSLFWDYKVVGNRGTRLIRIKVTRFQPRWTSVEHFELARFTNLRNAFLSPPIRRINTKHVEGYIMEHVLLILERSRSLPEVNCCTQSY